MRILGPQALYADVLCRNLCVGCGGCVDLCPYFRTHKGKTAMLFPCNREMGRCHAVCPKTEVDLDALARKQGAPAYPVSPLGAYERIVAARAGDRFPKGDFQCGGTVTALITFALEKGIIETAVLTDRNGLEPVPVLASSPEAVARCAASKYTAAPTLAGLNQAIREGRRKIGVVGTPCQVTAVAQMRANPLQEEGFDDPVSLVVGLFCTWALDFRQLIALLSPSLDITTIGKMDIPPPPAEIMRIETPTGPMEIPLEQIRPLIPGGCRICPDMTAEWADLSVGVLEGQPAWNTLIIRTPAGATLVDQAVQEGWIETTPYAFDPLEHLEMAALGKKRRALIKADADGLLNSQTQKCPSALRLDSKTVAAIIAKQEG